MSVFAPYDPAALSNRKKQLVAKLMQQAQQAAGRSAAIGQAQQGLDGTLGTGQPFRGSSVHAALPAGFVTGNAPQLPSALVAALGPGGFGHPIVGHDTGGAPGFALAPGLGAIRSIAARALAGIGPGGGSAGAPIITPHPFGGNTGVSDAHPPDPGLQTAALPGSAAPPAPSQIPLSAQAAIAALANSFGIPYDPRTAAASAPAPTVGGGNDKFF